MGGATIGKGTAHRRFAVTINLHAVGRGRGLFLLAPARGDARDTGQTVRVLPFPYDDAAADVRRENLKYLAGNTPRVPA